jgi:hypothetical protein
VRDAFLDQGALLERDEALQKARDMAAVRVAAEEFEREMASARAHL